MSKFKIKCLDGQWRYIFCHSLNSLSPITGNGIITTESPARAYKSTPESAQRDLDYFTEHAHGVPVQADGLTALDY